MAKAIVIIHVAKHKSRSILLHLLCTYILCAVYCVQRFTNTVDFLSFPFMKNILSISLFIHTFHINDYANSLSVGRAHCSINVLSDTIYIIHSNITKEQQIIRRSEIRPGELEQSPNNFHSQP